MKSGIPFPLSEMVIVINLSLRFMDTIILPFPFGAASTELFIKLTEVYKDEKNINDKPINKHNYKRTECWEHTIMNSAINGITDTAKHIIAMDNLREWTTKNNRNKFPTYAKLPMN
jgi:hypothetical protein